MGRRGPRKQTAEELAAGGSWRAAGRAAEEAAIVRRVPKSIFLSKVPATPKWLKGEARPFFKLVCQFMIDLNVLTRVDVAWVETLAVHYREWRELSEAIEKLKVVLETEGGEAVTVRGVAVSDKGAAYLHPAMSARQICWKNLVGAARELGLTPAARAGLGLSLTAAARGPVGPAVRDRSEGAAPARVLELGGKR